jgi:hypothetical protein
MECHKCEWALRVPADKRAAMRFEETPCAACKLDESQIRGCSLLYQDDDEARKAYAEAYCTPHLHGGDEDDLASEMPVSVLADAVRLLMTLPRDALEVLRLRYGGLPYARIAEILEKNVDAVEKQHVRVLMKHPVLWTLFPEKGGKRRLRKNAERSTHNAEVRAIGIEGSDRA